MLRQEKSVRSLEIQFDAGAGKLESDILPLAETILVMEIMDKVREIGGLKYPDEIEKV